MIDPGRLKASFEQHAAALRLYARQWLAQPQQAEDVVHEAFVALMTQPAWPDNPRAWLFRVVRNLSITAARSHSARTRHERSAGRSELFEQKVEDRIDARAAETALATLPIEQREIVVLRIWGQLTFAEIADLTGSPISTVFDDYRGALEAVREKLESQCKTNRT
jgi:RNA polymerase sigma-70 factor (ECF subfamily)